MSVPVIILAVNDGWGNECHLTRHASGRVDYATANGVSVALSNQFNQTPILQAKAAACATGKDLESLAARYLRYPNTTRIAIAYEEKVVSESDRIEHMAMAAWAAHRNVTKDIETRWNSWAEDSVEGDHWRNIAKAVDAASRIAA